MLVKVQATDGGNAQAVREFILKGLQRATAKLQRYERIRARLLDGRGEEEYLDQSSSHLGAIMAA
jgi:hypothetical protein